MTMLTLAALIAFGFRVSLAEASLPEGLINGIRLGDQALPHAEIEYRVRISLLDEAMFGKTRVDYDNAVFLLAFSGSKVRWEFRDATLLIAGERLPAAGQYALPAAGQYAFDGQNTAFVFPSPRVSPDGEVNAGRFGRIQVGRARIVMGDIRHWGILHEQSGLPLNQVLEQEEVDLLPEEELSGSLCQVLDVAFPSGKKSKIWVDPEAGYRMRRVEDYHNGKLARMMEVTAFAEISDGVWLPHAGTAEVYTAEKGLVVRKELLSVNSASLLAIPDARFQFEFPKGVPVYDERVDEHFIAGGPCAECE